MNTTNDAHEQLPEDTRDSLKIAASMLFILFSIVALVIFLQYRGLIGKNERIDVLEQELTAARAEISVLEGRIATMTDSFNEIDDHLMYLYEETLDQTLRESHPLTGLEQPERMATCIDALERQYSYLATDNTEILDEMSEAMRATQSARANARELRRQTALSDSIARARLTLLDEAEARITRLESSIEEYRRSLDDARDRAARMEERLSAARTEVVSVRQTVYVLVGNREDLLDRNIIREEGGLFRSKSYYLSANFDSSEFTGILMDEAATFNIEAPPDRIGLIPPRPSNSFSMDKTADGGTVIRVIDRDSFWKLPYLVITME